MTQEERTALMAAKRETDGKNLTSDMSDPNPFPEWSRKFLKDFVTREVNLLRTWWAWLVSFFKNPPPVMRYDPDNRCYRFKLDKSFDESEELHDRFLQCLSAEYVRDDERLAWRRDGFIRLTFSEVGENEAMDDLVASLTPAGSGGGGGQHVKKPRGGDNE